MSAQAGVTSTTYNRPRYNSSALPGDTLFSLRATWQLTQRVNITKSLTIDGNGHTVSADFDNTSNSNSNNATLEFAADDITVENVTIDGANHAHLHGINTYKVTGAYISNVTLKNNTKNGLVVNGSEVTVNNITTTNNSWGGIDVDLGSGVSGPADLTVTGTSHHSEVVAIKVDDTTKDVHVHGAGSQYTVNSFGNTDVYTLNSACSSDLSTFDPFTTGSVDGQHGWKSTGPFDQSVVLNTYGYSSFGCKSLRISNGVTSGSFGNQTFSAPAGNLAGEGVTNDHYDASFSFGSTKQSEQSGQAISVSPDDGTGNRMSYVSLSDDTTGTKLTFYDVQGTGNPANFVATDLGTYSRDQSHTIRFVIDFKPGPSNDVVKVYVDGVLKTTGTTWENYYRYDSEQAGYGNVVPNIDRLIFRTAGTSVPANLGYGYLVDNVDVTTSKNDVTPPPAPSITAPGARTWHKTSPILDQWTTVSDPSGIDHYQIAYNYDDGHSFGGTNTCPGLTMSGVSGFIGCRDVTGTQRNHSPNTNEEGGVTIWVRAVDGAGNVGPWSSSVHYFYDHTAPATTISAPTGLSDGTFTVSGHANDNLQLNRVYVQLVNREDNHRYGGTTINLIPDGTSADWSRNYDANTDGLPDGTYAAHVTVVDMAGNTSSAGWTDNFVVDGTAPSVSNIVLNGQAVAPADVRSANCQTPTHFYVVNGTVDLQAMLADAGSGVANARYKVRKVSSGGCTQSSIFSSGYVNMSNVAGDEWDDLSGFDTTTVPSDGTYTIMLLTRDAAGNDTTSYVDIMVDNTAPDVTDNFTVNILSNDVVTLSPTVSDAHDVTYLWTPSNTAILNSSHEPLSNPTLTIGPAPVGTYTVDLDVTDTAGNVKTVTYTVNVSAPAIVSFSVPPVTTPANAQAPSPPTPQNNAGNGGNANNQQVLGAETTTSNSGESGSSTSGDVKGASTKNLAATGDTIQHSKFLGLGWWWVPLVIALFGLFWFLLGRRDERSVK